MQKKSLRNNGIIFLIVAYKKWDGCKTLESIIKKLNKNDEVYIWVNSGTVGINKKKLLVINEKLINLIKSKDNTPLSIIYNNFIDYFKYSSKPLLILDDDSDVSGAYINDIRCKMSKISHKNKAMIPLAASGEEIISPIQSSISRKQWNTSLLRPPNIIASGLCLGRNLRNSIKFDTSFYFYGADTMYGYSIFNKKLYGFSVSSHKIFHTPSTNNGGITEFKYKSLISSQFLLYKRTLIFKHLYLLILMSTKYICYTFSKFISLHKIF